MKNKDLIAILESLTPDAEIAVEVYVLPQAHVLLKPATLDILSVKIMK